MIMLSSRQNTIRRMRGPAARSAAGRRGNRAGFFCAFAALLSILAAGCGDGSKTQTPLSGPVSAAFDAATVAGLSALEKDQNELAEKDFRTALDLTKPWPESDLRIVLTLLNHGTALTFLERFDEANADFERGLQLMQANHPEDFDTRGDLEFRRGDLYRQKGDADQADTWYKKADASLAQSPSHPHSLQAKVCHGLAMTALGLRGQPDLAQPQFKRSLDFLTAAGQTETLEMCVLLNNFASCYLRQNRSTEAQPLLDKAWQLEQAKFSDQRVTAETALGLGHLAYLDKQYSVAEVMFQKAYDYFQKNLGPEAGFTQQALANLAEAHLACGHRDDGVASYETWVNLALKRTAPLNDQDRNMTAVVLAKLDNLYKQGNQFGQAVSTVDRLIAFYAKNDAADSAPMAEALTEKANLLNKLGRDSDVKTVADQALPMVEKQLVAAQSTKPADPEALVASRTQQATLLSQKANLLRLLGRTDEAKAATDQAADLRAKNNAGN